MKPYLQYILSILTVCFLVACSTAHDDHDGEKPIQHLKLEDITSVTKAKETFLKEAAFITAKTKLDAGVLQEIHMSTYSLEKAVAYYVENSEGSTKKIAEQIAVVVEEIHLASENNRAEDAKMFIESLASLVKQFQTKL